MSPGGATENVYALSPTSRASQSSLIGQGERPSCVCKCTGWKPDLESLAFRGGKSRGGPEKAARLPLLPLPASAPKGAARATWLRWLELGRRRRWPAAAAPPPPGLGPGGDPSWRPRPPDETVGGLAVPEPGVRVAGAEDVDAAEPALPLPVREHDERPRRASGGRKRREGHAPGTGPRPCGAGAWRSAFPRSAGPLCGAARAGLGPGLSQTFTGPGAGPAAPFVLRHWRGTAFAAWLPRPQRGRPRAPHCPRLSAASVPGLRTRATLGWATQLALGPEQKTAPAITLPAFLSPQRNKTESRSLFLSSRISGYTKGYKDI